MLEKLNCLPGMEKQSVLWQMGKPILTHLAISTPGLYSLLFGYSSRVGVTQQGLFRHAAKRPLFCPSQLMGVYFGLSPPIVLNYILTGARGPSLGLS